MRFILRAQHINPLPLYLRVGVVKLGDVVRTALYTALVFAATIVLQVYTPATRGYFNFGETAIYTIAALTTPLIAGIAGGVGSALADIITGYGVFAPGTLVIKFTEGFVASYLIRKFSSRSGRVLRYVSIVVSVGVGLTISLLGIIRLSGIAELTSIPISMFGVKVTLLSGKIFIGRIVWLAVGILVTASLLYAVLVKGRENVSLALAMLIGGILMVTGYFLYEYYYTNPIIYGAPAEQALIEVPVNFGQVLVGLSVALPIVSFITKAVGNIEVAEAKESKCELSI